MVAYNTLYVRDYITVRHESLKFPFLNVSGLR